MKDEMPPEVKRKLAAFQVKQYTAESVKQQGDARILEIISSTEHVDRDGDIIRQKWDLKNYRRAPRVQLWHGPETIGKSLRERVIDWRGHKALSQDVAFLPEGVSGTADAQWVLYRGGWLNQWSVGFKPKKVTHVQDDKEREELGLGRFGVVFEKSELLETSAVPIPANQETDTIGLAEKMIREGELRSHHMDALEASNMLAPVLKQAWVNARPRLVFPPTDKGDVISSVLLTTEPFDTPVIERLASLEEAVSEIKDLLIAALDRDEEDNKADADSVFDRWARDVKEAFGTIKT